jgi:hypothetical protein
LGRDRARSGQADGILTTYQTPQDWTCEAWPSNAVEDQIEPILELVAVVVAGFHGVVVDDLDEIRVRIDGERRQDGLRQLRNLLRGIEGVSLIESAKGATRTSDAIVAVVTSVRSGTRLDLSTTSHE